MGVVVVMILVVIYFLWNYFHGKGITIASEPLPLAHSQTQVGMSRRIVMVD
jgi:hypothetical protein